MSNEYTIKKNNNTYDKIIEKEIKGKEEIETIEFDNINNEEEVKKSVLKNIEENKKYNENVSNAFNQELYNRFIEEINNLTKGEVNVRHGTR